LCAPPSRGSWNCAERKCNFAFGTGKVLRADCRVSYLDDDTIRGWHKAFIEGGWDALARDGWQGGHSRTGRIARLIELDPLYCDVICRRYEAITGQAD
jgi:hypothetical protein